MDMVFPSVERKQCEVRAHFGHDLLTPVEHLRVEHATPVWGDERHMGVDVVDDAATLMLGLVAIWVSQVVARFAA